MVIEIGGGVPFLAQKFLGNTVEAWLVAAGVFAGVMAVLWIVKRVALARLARLAAHTETDLDDFVIGLLRQVGAGVAAVVALYFATRSLALPESAQTGLRLLLVVVLTVKAVRLLQVALEFFVRRWIGGAGSADAGTRSAVANITKVGAIALWAGAILFVLENLGVDVTAAVVGLGVGGVALAFAAQAILGDVFSALAIFVDKPFKPGDAIAVGDLAGTVEHVGLQSTRLRSVGGEEVCIANKDLTSSRVRNFQRMESRRVLAHLGVRYETSTAQVKAIPGIIRGIVEEQGGRARFDRAHFARYGDSALVFEVVYFVLSPDYEVLMDVQQAVNIRIKEEFERQGIRFAYPTHVVHMVQGAAV